MSSFLSRAVTRYALVILALALPVALPAPSVAQSSPPRFPHARHEKLFPQCSGCHTSSAVDERVMTAPDTTLCGQCHNGRDRRKVAWVPTSRTPSNLSFSHKAHELKVGASGSTCQSCHAEVGAKWMHVGRAANLQCQGCHTHKSDSHFAINSTCATCHRPLSQAKELSLARIAAFPQPESHTRGDFATQHGVSLGAASLQCATCHARESCARCHMNATEVAAQFSLTPDARVATFIRSTGKRAVYPLPASHATTLFGTAHGALARANVQSCASCHARSSCQSCHTGPGGADLIAQLSVAENGSAPGVVIRSNANLKNRALPWRLTPNEPVPDGAIDIGRANVRRGASTDSTQKAVVHPGGFVRSHGVQAATSRPTCEGCHSRSYCAECHAGESSRRFHPSNFTARHAPDAWGREVECQQCHNREVFCRGCHLQVGLNSKGRNNVAYHSATPLWSLQHGQAARQGLQSCTSCHVQKDCMQCHSQSGRGINPHGPGFDAKRMWKANRLICLRCHFKDPLTGA